MEERKGHAHSASKTGILSEQKLASATIEEFAEMCRNQLVALDKAEVRVAVTGMSGAGKSLLINTLRGLPHERAASGKAKWAQVNVKEATTEPTHYPHPTNPKIVFVDLPGVNTKSWPQDTYMQRINFESYDFCIIVTKDRFLATDIWLMRGLRELGLRFFLVRSHIDNSIKTNREQNPDNTEERTLRTVLCDIQKNLSNEGFRADQVKVYLLSCRYRHLEKWDFPSLMEDVLNVLAGWKRDAFLLSVPTYTEHWIKLKEGSLRKVAVFLSLAAAATTPIPLPGSTLVGEMAIYAFYIERCKSGFGLTPEHVTRIYGGLAAATQIQALVREVAAYAVNRGGQVLAGTLFAEASKWVPALGVAVAACTTAVTTYSACEAILKAMTSFARQMASAIAAELQH